MLDRILLSLSINHEYSFVTIVAGIVIIIITIILIITIIFNSIKINLSNIIAAFNKKMIPLTFNFAFQA